MSAFFVKSSPFLAFLNDEALDVDVAPEADPQDRSQQKRLSRNEASPPRLLEVPVSSSSQRVSYRLARFKDTTTSSDSVQALTRTNPVRHVLAPGQSLQHFLNDVFITGCGNEYYVGVEEEEGVPRLVLYDVERAPYCAGSCDLKVKVLGLGKYDFTFCDTEGFMGKLWVPLSPLRWGLDDKKMTYWIQYWTGASLFRHKAVAGNDIVENHQQLIRRIEEIGELFRIAGFFSYFQEAFKLDGLHRHTDDYNSFVDAKEDFAEPLDDFVDRLDAVYGLNEFTLRFWRNGAVTASEEHLSFKESPDSAELKPEQRVMFRKVADHVFDVFLWDDDSQDWVLLNMNLFNDLDSPEAEKLTTLLRRVFSDDEGGFFDNPIMRSHIENLVGAAGRAREASN